MLEWRTFLINQPVHKQFTVRLPRQLIRGFIFLFNLFFLYFADRLKHFLITCLSTNKWVF